ncbi:hypothetical protein SAY86_022783 [Trapa natans]|uniref:Uncharacterized protein n=1 Tax=Trapa natans TaxID=22666 RepID=A0AAN7RAY7_TRANT|nr:hypothetical protein SAY86_022783 [Trapa natans]
MKFAIYARELHGGTKDQQISMTPMNLQPPKVASSSQANTSGDTPPAQDAAPNTKIDTQSSNPYPIPRFDHL